jgi:hypothetical protein
MVQNPPVNSKSVVAPYLRSIRPSRQLLENFLHRSTSPVDGEPVNRLAYVSASIVNAVR